MSEISEVESAVVATVVLEELTEQEAAERVRLELKVERAFFEAGTALRELRDKRLYRSTHRTFEDYVRERFGFTRFSAYNKIAAASVFENLLTNGQQILPANERQVRDLTGLEPGEQREVWQQALKAADGKVPSGRIVKSIVQRLKEKPLHLASDYCQPGEVFFLQRLAGAERKYNGCWAVAIEVENRFSVKAAVYQGVVEVRQDQMKRIDSEQTQAQIKEIHERIQRLLKCQLDPIDEAQIEFLCRRPWFTPRQKQALSAMEKVYGVE
jgi:hypothetical protein